MLGDDRARLLIEQIPRAPSTSSPEILAALAAAGPSCLAPLRDGFATAGNLETRSRFAIALLELGEPDVARSMLAIDDDPSDRVAFIHHFAGWHGDLACLTRILGDARDPVLCAGLCTALGAIPRDQMRDAELRTLGPVLRDLYVESPDGATHSVAGWVLHRWGIEPPAIAAERRAPAGRHWFVNGLGLTMVEPPIGSVPSRDAIVLPLWMSTTEVTVGQFRRFLEDREVPLSDRTRGLSIPVGVDGDLPMNGLSFIDAVLFCNWLSRREGRTPCYVRAPGDSESDEWLCHFGADGYRLPTRLEWDHAAWAGATTRLALGLLVLAGDAPGQEDVRFHTNFEGGSLGRIERIGPDAYRCHVRGQQDQSGRNRQASWYFFRIDGASGRELTLILTDLIGEYNGRPGAVPMGPEIRPVISDDGERWTPIADTCWDDRTKEATLRIRPARDIVWIAHQPPYTPSRLARLLEEIDRRAQARVEVIGKSARGRDLHLVTVTDPAFDDRGKAVVWLQARQHAWESGTSFVMEGALRFITSDDPGARALRRRAVFLFTPMVDPDGCASGQVRFNANGYDVNRHWDEVDLKSKRYLARMPEIWYVKKAIVDRVESGRPIDLLVNLHNTETAEYLSTMAADRASRAIVDKLNDRLTRETTFRSSHGPVFAAARVGTARRTSCMRRRACSWY